MKYRIIGTLLLIAVLAVCYVIMQNPDSSGEQESAQDGLRIN